MCPPIGWPARKQRSTLSLRPTANRSVPNQVRVRVSGDSQNDATAPVSAVTVQQTPARLTESPSRAPSAAAPRSTSNSRPPTALRTAQTTPTASIRPVNIAASRP